MLTSEKALQSEFNRQETLYCKYCHKECHSLNSLKQHEIRCKENPERISCNNLAEYSRKYKKGQTKETSEEIAKQAAVLRKKYKEGYVSPAKGRPGSFTGRKHSAETKARIGGAVSVSRSVGYANGSITPAKGVGRGQYSYIKTPTKTYMLRSTYEFIYSLYLLHNNIEFSMENIRVPAVKENRWAKTFICDFNVGNKVIEIKGIASGKDVCIKQSFEAAGYEFEELFYDDIEQIKEQLSIYYPIDDLLEKISEGHRSKNYFVYNFEYVDYMGRYSVEGSGPDCKSGA